MVKKDKDMMALILLAGAGIGGYFLWRYFKGPKDVKKGFNISKITWNPFEPIKGEEIVISCIGKNYLTEQLDGYCKIIDLSNQQEVFYDHSLVNPDEIKGFEYSTIMPDELKLRFETGTIIDEKQEINSYQEITIKSSIEQGKVELSNLEMVIPYS